MASNIQPKDLINSIVMTSFPYFDIKKGKKSFKIRPVLIIGCEKETFQTDFTVLPVSSVTNKEHLHEEYDINIGKLICPNLKNIKADECFVRVHKPTTINSNEIIRNKPFDDLPSLYLTIHNEIVNKWKQFNLSLFK